MWTILGIEPTKDKKAITAAYRAKLKVTNPEEKPEEFKALRAAYEKALEYAAKTEEAPAADTTPVGLWMARVREVYNDFPARIRTSSWEELLSDDILLGMDTRPKAEEALLRFFMEDYFIPNAVWRLLDGYFHWIERREELYESFPREFIDFAVVNGVRLQANLPYELYTPGLNGKECDAYRRLYHDATNTPVDQMGPILDKMEAMSETHPYGEMLRCREYFLQDATRPKALEVGLQLAEAHPGDVFLQLEYASMSMLTGAWAETERMCLRVLDLDAEQFNAKRMLAEVLAQRGEYDRAKEHIYDLMRSVGGDQMQTYHLGQTLQKWNNEMIAQKEALLMSDPDNSKHAIELGWCYLQNDRHDDALRMALLARSDYEDQYDYYNFLAKVYYAREEYEPALKYFYELERVMEGLDPTADEKTAKRKRRLPEVVQLQGSCLLALKREEEGKARYLKALELDPDNAEIITYTARMFAGLKDYQAALPLLERVIAMMPTAYHGHYLMGQVFYELGRDREALDCVDKALNFEGGDLGVYVLKMRIFIRNAVWEPVRELLAFLDGHKVGDDPSVLWCKAQMAEFADGNRGAALELYRQVAEKLDAGAYLDWASKVYYRVAMLSLDKLDMNKPEDRNFILELAEKGLKYDEEDPNCLEYKAWVLRRNEKIDEALEIYHKLEEYVQHPISVEYNLAELYYKNLQKNADKAWEYYLKLIAHDEEADQHFYAGTACRYLRRLEEAEQHFLREIALAPEDVDGYNGLAYVYDAMGRSEEALVQVDKAIEIAAKKGNQHLFLHTHKILILRRIEQGAAALAAVREAMGQFDNYDGHQDLFDICTQFGWWEEARQVLKEQKAAEGTTSQWAANKVKLLCMTNNLLKAKMEYARVAKYLSEEDKEDVRMILADLSGKLDKVIEIWQKRLPDSTDPGHVYLNLALNECQRGRRAEAVPYAEKGLALAEEQLTLYLTNEPLYRSRRAVLLAILGREEEAWAELALCRSLPLCASCNFGFCKDADLFEANIHELLGNKEKALELYEKYHAMWPDELDMLGGINRLKK